MDLINAVRKNYIIRVHELLDSGVDPNIRDRNGDTILLFASMRGRTEIVRLLLQRGDEPNLENTYSGHTPLYEASSSGYTDIVKLLLENNADPNITRGYTPLHLASMKGYTNIVKLLLENGANPNIRNDYGESAYDIALDRAEYDLTLDKRYIEISRLIKEHIDLQRMQRPLQNLAFMKYFLDRDDLDIDTASKIFSNVYSYNPEVGRRIRDEQRRNMILEEENNRIADYLNTIEKYGSGKRSKGKHGKKRSSKHYKKRSTKKKY